MVKKPTSITLDDTELIELQTDAKSEGMTVTQYLKQLARERKAIKQPEIKEEPMVKEEEMSKEEMQEIARNEARKQRDEEKTSEMLGKIYDKQCRDGDCLQDVVKRLDRLENYKECPGCHKRTLKEGMNECPNCHAEVDWG